MEAVRGERKDRVVRLEDVEVVERDEEAAR
jgi:hypothetical protein